MAKLRVSDYIAQKISELGVRDVFLVTGGGAMYLNDSFGHHKHLNYYPFHHEQSCAIAAEGYYRASGNIPLVNVTMGPGCTNAITGVFGQWTDSVPAVCISGNVKFETTQYSCPDIVLRQLGDQELDIIKLIKPITKYAEVLTDPNQVRKVIEKAFYMAKHGRPGPVWIDIPLNVQAAMVDPSTLEAYDQREDELSFDYTAVYKQIDELFKQLTSAKSPVILIGSGIRTSGSEDVFLHFIEKLNIPVLSSISGVDILPSNHPLNFGKAGLRGDRVGNMMIQNADVLLVMGNRVSIRQTSYNYTNFAEKAFKVMVDIDEGEMSKPIVNIDLKIKSELNYFMELFLSRLGDNSTVFDYHKWINFGNKIRTILPSALEDNIDVSEKVNSYHFAHLLFDLLPEESVVVTGVGNSNRTTTQVLKVKKGSRFISNQGCASMGYDLPAAIGASIARNRGDVNLLTGDGSIMMNIQELQTISTLKLPIKIFLFSNKAYGTIRGTQNAFFNGQYVGESGESNVEFPDFKKIADGFGIQYVSIKRQSDVRLELPKVLALSGPVFCELEMDVNQVVQPRVTAFKGDDGKIYSHPMEKMFPFISPEMEAECSWEADM